MAENNSFVDSEAKTIDIEHKDGLLEELELPPHLIKFIRENAQRLQIAAVCIVILILGWTYYDYHSQNVENDASAALNSALLEDDEASRIELLKNVEKDFSGTESALWSRIEQAHLSAQAGNHDDALLAYNDLLDDINADNPLKPLLHYNIGLAYENSGEPDKALRNYVKLAGFKGFEAKALISQGRIHEMENDRVEALRLYRQAVESEDTTSQDKLFLQEKIDSLQTAEGISDQG
jgi:predicted negative regulator of RcsB-dependent stress response